MPRQAAGPDRQADLPLFGGLCLYTYPLKDARQEQQHSNTATCACKGAQKKQQRQKKKKKKKDRTQSIDELHDGLHMCKRG